MKLAHLVRVCLIWSTLALAQNPVPFVNQPLVPDATAPGGGSFTLTVNGTGFVSGATVDWNGTVLATTFVSSSQLTATVPGSNIATASTASVTVTNPAPGGGISNLQLFSVASPALAPAFTTFVQALLPGGDLNNKTNLVTADFDGDGKPDLAGVIGGDAFVWVMLNRGDGSFQPPIKFYPGESPGLLLAADFNGDGKIDLVATNNYESTVSVSLGNGDGTFQNRLRSESAYLSAAGVAADFNGDGKLDLAVGDNANLVAAILLGNGDGTFQPPVTYQNDGLPVFGMTVGDFNRDGKLDLVTEDLGPTDTTLEVRIFFGNGDGTFQANNLVASVPTGVLEDGPEIAAADLNGDGKLDLVTAGTNGVLVLLGNGDGTFQPPVQYGDPADSEVLVANFNADSALDVFTFGEFNSSLLLGIGDGTFQPYLNYPISLVDTPPGVAADFNGDGKMDAAFTPNEPLTVLLQGQVPLAGISPTSLTFHPQLPGTTSPAQTVTLSNSGTGAMTIANISINGPNAGDFAQTNICGSSLAVSSSCPIKITFTPAAEGAPMATLAITDNSPGSPQTVGLSGTVPDFMVSAIAPTTQTVTPGQAANYSVAISPVNGFDHTVSLTCSGGPGASTCTVTPNSVTLDGANAVTVSVAVVTTGNAMGLTRPPGPPSRSVLASWLAFSGTLGLMLIAGSARWHRQWSPRRLYALALVCLLSVGLTTAGCGGGGGSGSASGTPTGTYTLTVTGSYGSGSGTVTSAAKLTLVVK